MIMITDSMVILMASLRSTKINNNKPSSRKINQDLLKIAKTKIINKYPPRSTKMYIDQPTINKKVQSVFKWVKVGLNKS